jgi:hypothetical protein
MTTREMRRHRAPQQLITNRISGSHWCNKNHWRIAPAPHSDARRRWQIASPRSSRKIIDDETDVSVQPMFRVAGLSACAARSSPATAEDDANADGEHARCFPPSAGDAL